MIQFTSCMHAKQGGKCRQAKPKFWVSGALPLSAALKQVKVKLKVLIKTGTVGKQVKIKSRSPKLIGAKVQQILPTPLTSCNCPLCLCIHTYITIYIQA